MNSVAHFIVELSWAMSMGLLLALGVLMAQAVGLVAAGLAVVAGGWLVWKRLIRR